MNNFQLWQQTVTKYQLVFSKEEGITYFIDTVHDTTFSGMKLVSYLELNIYLCS